MIREKETVVIGVLLALVFCIIGTSVARAQDQDYDQISAKYEPAVREVLDWLATNPPLEPGDETREAMLIKLDPVLLEPDAKKLPAVGMFFKERMDAFLDDFENTTVESGAVIWKLYNHTEVIRTPGITLVIDLISGFYEVSWEPEALDRAIAGIDAMLISHEHADHADPVVVKKFLDAGKPVIAPPGFWEDQEFAAGITRFRDDSMQLGDVNIHAFPSFQKLTINNVYLLKTEDGLRIMHLGDDNATLKMGQEWFRVFKKPYEIDVLIPNCWCPNLALLLQKLKPKIMISSHENELGHPVHGRREYGELYPVLRTVGVPFLVPAWGEKYILTPDS